MSVPHCSDPSRCSQCLAAPVRTVTIHNGVNHVDGQPIAKHVGPRMRGSIKGGAALRRKVAGHKRGARDL